MSWQTGMMYAGQFVEDKKSGDGKFSWPDGRVYEGQWQQGKQHGRGTFRTREGVPWTGHWLSGRRVDENGQAIPATVATEKNPSPEPSARLALPAVPDRAKFDRERTEDSGGGASSAVHSQLSMDEVKTQNLMARFPHVTEAQVRATLVSVGGHAGMAAAALKQTQMGIQEADQLPLSPVVAGLEPAMPP